MNVKTQQSQVILDLFLQKTWAGKSHNYRCVIHFEKLCFHNQPRPQGLFPGLGREKAVGTRLFSQYFSSTRKRKACSVFKKLCFRDGLVWTVGLTAQIKLRIQIQFSGVVWTRPKKVVVEI